jgi:hypothetical protein
MFQDETPVQENNQDGVNITCAVTKAEKFGSLFKMCKFN